MSSSASNPCHPVFSWKGNQTLSSSFYDPVSRLRYICAEEKLDMAEESLNKLVELSDGDLRKSITRLQSMSSGCKSITTAQVVELCGQVDETVVARFIEECKKPTLASIEGEVKEFVLSGYSSVQFLRQLAPHIINDSSLKGTQKARVLIRIAVGRNAIFNLLFLIQRCPSSVLGNRRTLDGRCKHVHSNQQHRRLHA